MVAGVVILIGFLAIGLLTWAHVRVSSEATVMKCSPGEAYVTVRIDGRQAWGESPVECGPPDPAENDSGIPTEVINGRIGWNDGIPATFTGADGQTVVLHPGGIACALS